MSGFDLEMSDFKIYTCHLSLNYLIKIVLIDLFSEKYSCNMFRCTLNKHYVMTLVTKDMMYYVYVICQFCSISYSTNAND